MSPLVMISALVALLPHVRCFAILMGAIPNGHAVPNPCRPGIWAGVGHLSPLGNGPNNRFGIDMEANNMVWNWRLCRRDSDGDGVRNGAELGDPSCRWRPGGRTRRRPRGHPGICEPINSPRCRNQIRPC